MLRKLRATLILSLALIAYAQPNQESQTEGIPDLEVTTGPIDSKMSGVTVCVRLTLYILVIEL
jgi:hypothetical protein